MQSEFLMFFLNVVLKDFLNLKFKGHCLECKGTLPLQEEQPSFHQAR